MDHAAGTWAVRELIERLGLAVLDDAPRVEAGLSDLLSMHPREIHVLTVAAKAGLARELAAQIKNADGDSLRDRIAEDSLCQGFLLQPDAARWALRCWREGIAASATTDTMPPPPARPGAARPARRKGFPAALGISCLLIAAISLSFTGLAFYHMSRHNDRAVTPYSKYGFGLWLKAAENAPVALSVSTYYIYSSTVDNGQSDIVVILRPGITNRTGRTLGIAASANQLVLLSTLAPKAGPPSSGKAQLVYPGFGAQRPVYAYPMASGHWTENGFNIQGHTSFQTNWAGTSLGPGKTFLSTSPQVNGALFFLPEATKADVATVRRAGIIGLAWIGSHTGILGFVPVGRWGRESAAGTFGISG